MNSIFISNYKTLFQSYRKVIVVLFFLGAFICGFSQVPTYYNSNTGTPSNSFPFAQNGKATQYLLLPGEFTGAPYGYITKLYVQGTPNISATWTTFIIKLGTTTLTALPSGVIYTGSLTTVLSASSINGTSTSAGWMAFALQTPFPYDPTKSLVIDISQCGWTGGSFAVTNNSTATIRRTYITPTSCSFAYTGQDANIFNCGVDLSSFAYNDAGVLSIDSPTAFCGGVQNIKATIKNYGRNQINPVTVNWSLNGVVQTPYNYTTLLDTIGKPNNTAQVFLGSYNFPVPTVLKVWTSYPNNVADTANVNDTAIVSKAPALSGAYTINASGTGSYNFTTFSAMAAVLNSGGVCGPVTVTVAPGTYNEQISLGNIFGASATNTIIIDGVDTSTRILTFNAGSSGPNAAVIQLNGAKYVTIKNLNIINTNSTQNTNGYYGVQITNIANFNNILGCKITVPIYGAGGVLYPVAVAICGSTYSTNGDNGNYNVIDGNRIIGGYYGLTVLGTAVYPSTSTNNRITNNKVEMAYYMGMYLYYGANLVVDHNTIINGPYYASDYGIYAYYLNNSDITRNLIGSSYYGILFYTYTSSNTGTCNINNNMLYSQSTGTSYYGLYISNANNTNIIHNTVYNNKANGAAFYNFISYTGNRVNNNIFMVTQSVPYAIYVPNVSATYYNSLDYNTIIAPSSNINLAYWGGTIYSTLASLKSAFPTFNQNNNGIIPVFQSATDLHLSTAMEQARGLAGTGVNIDIDGDARCSFAPSYGADESGYLTPPPTAGFTVGTIYLNSPTTLLNNYSSTLPMSHKWYVNGNPVGTNPNLIYTFTTAGNYNVALRSTNCSGTDSINIVVTVVLPTLAPSSNFVASPNSANTFQNINLTDLSTNGPTSWVWSISPGTLGIDYFFTAGTSSTSQNPILYFATSGIYNLCLKATNSVGAGNNNCKTSYLVIQVGQSMCQLPYSSKVSTGNLYSSGGPAGGYNQNENCVFVIDACADSTFLNVQSASFGTGTVDKFEIYQGDYVQGAIPVYQFIGGTTYNNLPMVIKVKGKMTVREVTDATANNGQGIKANWYTTPGTFDPPFGSISGSSNAYICSPAVNNYYSSTFRDPTYLYEWDFNKDGQFDMTGMDASNIFTILGPDTMVLRITGCGGTFTTTKIINVIPAPVPSANFSTTLFTATPVDTIPLNDNSDGGVLSWKWTITGPGAISYVGGTNSITRNPKIIATVPGSYNVKLFVSNCAGTDSITKTSYFKIIGYCVPTAGNLLTDLSIANFQLGSINNTIITPAPGTVAYRDFTQQYSTNADRGATYTFSIRRAANNNNAGIKIWVDWNQDGTFDPSSELVASTVTGSLTWTSTLYTPKTATLGGTRLRIGVAFNTLSNTPCGANVYGEFQDYRLIVRPDVTPPVLTLGGSNPTFVEIGRNFIESGDIAIDAVDGILTDSISYSGYLTGMGYQLAISKQTTSTGTFAVIATARDLTGNISTKTRTVIVTPDTTKPVINLNGANPLFVEVFSNFTDPGATASDFYFTTPITVNSVNNVDTSKVGAYTVTYTAVDGNGNSALPVLRNVIVRDTQKPVVTLPSGTDTVYVEVGTTYTDAGANVTDNYYSGLTATRTGTVNTYVPGTYYYTFTATDGSGNVSISKTRVIIVRDGTGPQIILASPADPDTLVLDVKVYTVVPEPGYVATDNFYPSSQITVTKTGTVDLNKIGTYVVTYTASDPAGNTSTPKRRIYKLVDRIKPVITLNGSNSVNICRWRAYNELGATVTDNYWNGLQVSINSNVNVNVPGIYSITYTAIDSSGNVALPEYRYVNVYDFNSPNCTAFTGINKNSDNETFDVVPNPSNGLITINVAFKVETRSEVIIYNSLGQIIKVIDNSSIKKASYEVNLQNEPAGIYFIAVKSGDITRTKKLVLNK